MVQGPVEKGDGDPRFVGFGSNRQGVILRFRALADSLTVFARLCEDREVVSVDTCLVVAGELRAAYEAISERLEDEWNGT